MKLTATILFLTISALSFWTQDGSQVVYAATGKARIVINTKAEDNLHVDAEINGKKVASLNPEEPTYKGEIAPGKNVVTVKGGRIEIDAKPNHEYVLEVSMVAPDVGSVLLFGGLFTTVTADYSIVLKKTIKPEVAERQETPKVKQSSGRVPEKGSESPIVTSSVTTPDILAAQRVVVSEPSNAAAWRELGRQYQSAGEYEKALRAYEKANGLEPDNADTLEALGGLYAKAGQKENVRLVWERLSQIDKERAERFFSSYMLP